MSRRTWVILLKELVDNVRDHRAWSTSVIYILIGPLLLAALIRFVAKVGADESTRSLSVPVQGAERAPGLIEYLAQHNVLAKAASADPEMAVRDFGEDVVLVIPESYPDQVRAGRPATVRILYDDSRTFAQAGIHRLRDTLRGYGLRVGGLRLMARGVSPEVINGLTIENADLATPESRGVLVFAVVPMFLLLALFVGGLYVAIDTTAGERERHSLEPLLVNPISPAELILGKLGAALAFSVATLAVTLVGFSLVLNHPPAEIPGIRFSLSVWGTAVLFFGILPLALFASALQMLMASTSRSFKEAQTAGQFLALLPMVPGMLSVFGLLKPAPWMAAIPLFGHDLLIRSVLKGEPVPWAALAIADLSVLVLSVALIAVTIRRYQPYRALFG